MIGHLRGTVLRALPERVLLEVGGVGYELHIPLTTYYELEKLAPGTPVALHVHTHVRDDALLLYGFWSEQERQLFERLIAVSGIGPRLAQTILSGIPPAELGAAIAGGDLARLVAIPGVGKKTAERLLLELRDKVAELAAPAGAPAARSAAADDVLAALLNLGYRRAQAERAIARTLADDPELGVPELLRRSLKRLSRA
ncbi:MAG: Holliday junction branch migration protein RuvA [Acidobacteria bacterium]|nr:MAG: Holliday junction branch migration protein RuvA [Acidobacteriota bacterium]